MATIVRAFYASLFSTSAPQFDKLKESDLREVARAATAARIADVHTYVHSVISDKTNGYDGAALLTHTPGEVAVLLGVK